MESGGVAARAKMFAEAQAKAAVTGTSPTSPKSPPQTSQAPRAGGSGVARLSNKFVPQGEASSKSNPRSPVNAPNGDTNQKQETATASASTSPNAKTMPPLRSTGITSPTSSAADAQKTANAETLTDSPITTTVSNVSNIPSHPSEGKPRENGPIPTSNGDPPNKLSEPTKAIKEMDSTHPSGVSAGEVDSSDEKKEKYQEDSIGDQSSDGGSGKSDGEISSDADAHHQIQPRMNITPPIPLRVNTSTPPAMAQGGKGIPALNLMLKIPPLRLQGEPKKRPLKNKPVMRGTKRDGDLDRWYSIKNNEELLYETTNFQIPFRFVPSEEVWLESKKRRRPVSSSSIIPSSPKVELEKKKEREDPLLDATSESVDSIGVPNLGPSLDSVPSLNNSQIATGGSLTSSQTDRLEDSGSESHSGRVSFRGSEGDETLSRPHSKARAALEVMQELNTKRLNQAAYLEWDMMIRKKVEQKLLETQIKNSRSSSIISGDELLEHLPAGHRLSSSFSRKKNNSIPSVKTATSRDYGGSAAISGGPNDRFSSISSDADKTTDYKLKLNPLLNLKSSKTPSQSSINRTSMTPRGAAFDRAQKSDYARMSASLTHAPSSRPHNLPVDRPVKLSAFGSAPPAATTSKPLPSLNRANSEGLVNPPGTGDSPESANAATTAAAAAAAPATTPPKSPKEEEIFELVDCSALSRAIASNKEPVLQNCSAQSRAVAKGKTKKLKPPKPTSLMVPPEDNKERRRGGSWIKVGSVTKPPVKESAPTPPPSGAVTDRPQQEQPESYTQTLAKSPSYGRMRSNSSTELRNPYGAGISGGPEVAKKKSLKTPSMTTAEIEGMLISSPTSSMEGVPVFEDSDSEKSLDVSLTESTIASSTNSGEIESTVAEGTEDDSPSWLKKVLSPRKGERPAQTPQKKDKERSKKRSSLAILTRSGKDKKKANPEDSKSPRLGILPSKSPRPSSERGASVTPEPAIMERNRSQTGTPVVTPLSFSNETLSSAPGIEILSPSRSVGFSPKNEVHMVPSHTNGENASEDIEK